MLWIWSNSLWPAEQSAAQSGQVLGFLAPLFEASPIPQELWVTVIRKAAHLTEYALLGLLWAAALHQKERGALRSAPAALAVCLLAALLDETIQAFVPGRGSLVTDVWIDFFGSLCGAALWAAVCRLRHRPGAENGQKQGSGGTPQP